MSMLDLKNKEKLAETLSTICTNIRNRRQSVEEEWLRIHDAWKGTFTKSFFHSDVFNNYIPYFRRTIEKYAVRAAQMVLPNTEYFDVHPTDAKDPNASKKAGSVLAYLLHLCRKKIKTYSLAKQLFRTLALYGRCILRTGVDVVTEDDQKKVWPTARVVDPFMFYMWPETAIDIDKAKIVFEDAIISVEEYKVQVEEGMCDAVEYDKLTDPTWPVHVTRRLQTSNFTEPKSETADETGAKKKRTDWIFRSVVWMNEGNYWTFCWIVWNLAKPQIVKVSKSKFNRPNYRMSILREIPNEQYTSSMGNDQENLQILLNDYVNMGMEGQAMTMSPPVAMDVNLIQRHGTIQYKPRAKWMIPPEGVKPILTMQGEGNKISFQGINFAMSLMDSFGGVGGLPEGQTLRNMPRAGFAMSSLMSMSLADIRDSARTIEEEILSLMLHDFMSLTKSYVPERQLIKIPGTRSLGPRTLYLDDLDGDYDMNWIGSLQAQDFQARGQRAVAFLGQLVKLAPIIGPELQAAGKKINWAALLTLIWRDTMGEYSYEQIVDTIQVEPEMMQGQPGMQPGMPQQQLMNNLDISQLMFAQNGGGQ